jgi:SEFIR domain
MITDSISLKVFISYSHDSQIHKDRVLVLSDRLRNDGIDCNIDQYEPSPPEGWQRWMLKEIEAADLILIVCSEQYNRRFRGQEETGKGKGAIWEGGIIIQELYDTQGSNSKFIPIVLTAGDSKFIPSPLGSVTYYRFIAEDDYEPLYRRLTEQHLTPKQELGKPLKLEKRERQPISPIKSIDTQLIMNPFIYGNPVPPERFYGRQQAKLAVKNRIGALTSQSINIVGLRQIGKTSLLNYIHANPTEFIQPDKQPLIVSLNLQSNPVSTPAGIVEGLRRGIMNQLPGKEPWKEYENDSSKIEDGLSVMKKRGVRLIVMLDEFEAIASRLEDFQNWGDNWRSMSAQGLFSMVVASKRPISEIYQRLGLTSPFSNIFSVTILGGLEPNDWQQLVQDGFAGSNVSAETLGWIDELAGTLPLYVQMAASAMFQSANIHQAEEEFRLQAEQRLLKLWEDLRSEEKEVFCHLGDRNSTIVRKLQNYGLVRADGKSFSRVFTELFVRGQI